MFLGGAAGVGGHVGRGPAGLHEIVRQEGILDLLAGNVREHHAVNLHAGGQGLAGFADHLLVVGADVDDVDVLERQLVFGHDGADAIGPAAVRFEICFDFHGAVEMFGQHNLRGKFRSSTKTFVRPVPVSEPFPILSFAQAAEFAELGLANIRREFPHYLQHMLNAAGDARTPRELHPAFYGSYDWHSCVHQHWMLVRLALMFPALPPPPEIDRVLHEPLTAVNLQVEVDYFRGPGREFFERPYGWAWLLKLAQEIHAYDAKLEANMEPLVTYIRAGFMRYLRAL